MIPIFKSLDEVSTGYTVFEANQVLTHDQLNSIADYADDQIRLTRTKLTGVGVACGLNPINNSESVIVTKGVGVTTDGDLLYLDADTEYTHYKLYDETYPAYPPLYVGGDVNGTMITAYQLLTDDTDPDSLPVSDPGPTGMVLSQMVVVMLMESYLKDDDICSGTDCDNLGKEAKNRIKLILVDQETAFAMRENVLTWDAQAGGFLPIIVERPIMTASVTTPPQLALTYRNSCNNIFTAVTSGLSQVYSTGWGLLSGVFGTNPVPGWISQLTTIRTVYNNDANIQYYYDFLKDLAETFNSFNDLIFGDTTLCSPSPTLFPKHLLLGHLGTYVDTQLRTPWYPSMIGSQTSENIDRAQFLLKKIDTLIRTFSVQNVTDIRITPSSFEDVSLEKRAIPYYYVVTETTGVHRSWNYKLTKSRRERYNYSYHAINYSSLGGAANPLRTQMGRFSFFRIEGHFGKNVNTVMTTIKNSIKANNLPFAVIAVHAGASRTGVTVKPAIRYTDLHRVHQVLRTDIVQQLDDVTRYSNTLKSKIDLEPTTANFDVECNCAPRTFAANTQVTLNSRVATAQAKLNRPYTSYIADASWQDAMKNTLTTANDYKSGLSSVAKVDFLTPFDTITASPHVSWLSSIDTLIKRKDELEDDKLLLTNFIDRNPGLEHFAGVTRGGTFVLVYDTSNNVVADFMLPYYWVDNTETTVDEPVLARPDIKAATVLDNGIKVQPSRSVFVDAKVTTASNNITAAVNNTVATQLGFQNQYVGLFQSSIGMLGGAAARGDQALLASSAARSADAAEAMAAGGGAHYSDEYFTAAVNENNSEAQKLSALRAKAAAGAGSLFGNWCNTEATLIEGELRDSTEDFVHYLEAQLKYAPAASPYDVGPGSEAADAAAAITLNLVLLTDGEVKSNLRQVIETAKQQIDTIDFQDLCDAMLNALA